MSLSSVLDCEPSCFRFSQCIMTMCNNQRPHVLARACPPSPLWSGDVRLPQSFDETLSVTQDDRTYTVAAAKEIADELIWLSPAQGTFHFERFSNINGSVEVQGPLRHTVASRSVVSHPQFRLAFCYRHR